MPTGTCHCGKVGVVVGGPPRYGNACQCSLCRRYGVIWGYYHPADVRIQAAPDARAFYAWGEKNLSFGRCAACGTVTDWQETRDPAPTRMGINLRLFEPADLASVPIRQSAGPS